MVPLLLAWVALLAADRIDLFGTRGPFTLTPFLLLSPLLCAVAWRHRHRAGRPLAIPSASRRFLLLATVLMACAITSVFASRDLERSALRLVQLGLMMAGTTGVLLAIRDRPDARALLARGARWGIGVTAAVAVVQGLVLLQVIPAELPAGAPVLRLMPSTYAGIIPRFSGLVMDPNRTGLLLLLYAWLEGTGDGDAARRTRWLAAAVLLLLLTLSRSSLLAALGMVLVVAAQRAHAVRRGEGAGLSAARTPLVPAVALLVAVGAGALLVRPDWWEGTVEVGATVQQRFTVREGSAQDHLRLLARGVDLATRSIPEALRGIGYGSAHVALQDFFPGDKYGNFHSLYVGAFAETGAAGLLAVLLLLGLSLRAPATRAPVVAAALFGVFYSVLAEPTFWVLVLLPWVPLADPSSVVPNAVTTPTATANTAPSSS